MSEEWSAAPFLPNGRDLGALERAARRCTGCPLFRDTTQTVFGRGPSTARLILVGEQPGDREDIEGEPFVGPAGRVLRQCLEAADIDDADVYVTNAVKHFKHERRGKRRIHQRPTTAEVNACHPWLEAELEAVDSPVVVALGAVAVRALFGGSLGVAANRGRPFELGDRVAFITYHPSAVLRGDERADDLREALIGDLTLAGRAASTAGSEVRR
jgi:DNA polymerase